MTGRIGRNKDLGGSSESPVQTAKLLNCTGSGKQCSWMILYENDEDNDADQYGGHANVSRPLYR